MNKNNKVPMAILSCFLIAFIVQGILKISGVFIFEKALNWEIFNIIDNNMVLSIIYNSLIVLISVYCLSFALTGKLYTKKWHINLLIVTSAFGITLLKYFVKTPMYFEFIYDAILYIIIPVLTNILIGNKKDLILLISIQVLLYFTYLGLCYWSSMLNSLLPITQMVLSSSCIFLIYFEVYIGLILLMISLNIFIKRRLSCTGQ